MSDADAEDAKRARRSKQQASYEEDSDDEMEKTGEAPIGDEEIEAEFNKDDGKDESEMEDSPTPDDLEDVRAQFMKYLKTATSFSFDGSSSDPMFPSFC